MISVRLCAHYCMLSVIIAVYRYPLQLQSPQACAYASQILEAICFLCLEHPNRWSMRCVANVRLSSGIKLM